MGAPASSHEPHARAAVAVVLREGEHGQAEMLFIKRADDPNDPWSGHMAFPGGRHDPRDASLLETAMREAQEEVGLRLWEHTLVGQLADLPAMAKGKRLGLMISPYVFALGGSVELRPNGEVAEVVWAKVGPLSRGEHEESFAYLYEGVEYTLPSFRIGDHRVWGLTFQMTRALFERIAGGP